MRLTMMLAPGYDRDHTIEVEWHFNHAASDAEADQLDIDTIWLVRGLRMRQISLDWDAMGRIENELMKRRYCGVTA